MSDENLRYFEAFPNWLRSLADDAVAFAGILGAEATPIGARRSIAGGLNYLFKSLDLVPDGIDDIGYLDDAFVLRISARDALAHDGAKVADHKGVLERLAAEVPVVEGFLAGDFARLGSYVKELQKGAARGRTVEDIVNDAAIRKEFVSDVHSWAKGYSAPAFNRDEKTLVKLKAFLGSRLPAAK